jgi:hypothetical protein
MGWRNSDFQNSNFIISDAYSPWEQYRILKDQLSDRQIALASVQAMKYRMEAKRLELKSLSKKKRLLAAAELVEIDAQMPQVLENIEYAKNEIKSLENHIQYIMPDCEATRRKNEDGTPWTDLEMFQIVQQGEWKYRLIDRIRNEIVCHTTIEPETLRVAMSHPDFKTGIVPVIKTLLQKRNPFDVMSMSPQELLDDSNTSAPHITAGEAGNDASGDGRIQHGNGSADGGNIS